MLFMVIEHFRPGKAVEVYRRLRDLGRMPPEGVRYISSWVDLNFQRCSGHGGQGRSDFQGMDGQLG